MKKFNLKREALFFSAGAAAALCVTALAAQMEVNPNPFPITVNGAPVEIEGYNLNDNTYFKLRDIGDKLGFSVDFENDTIVITKQNSSAPTTLPGLTGEIPADGKGATPEQALSELKERLSQKVASGDMTQAEADEIIKSFGDVSEDK